MTDSTARLRFERRPSPVMAEHRPLYKIGQILLVLYLASRGGKSSLPRLHLFNWAFKSPARQDMLVKAAATKILDVPAWGFDPVLAIGVRFALAERLIRETSTGYEIAEGGEIFVVKIIKHRDLFASEREFLSRIGKSITEAMVDAAARGWEVS